MPWSPGRPGSSRSLKKWDKRSDSQAARRTYGCQVGCRDVECSGTLRQGRWTMTRVGRSKSCSRASAISAQAVRSRMPTVKRAMRPLLSIRKRMLQKSSSRAAATPAWARAPLARCVVPQVPDTVHGGVHNRRRLRALRRGRRAADHSSHRLIDVRLFAAHSRFFPRRVCMRQRYVVERNDRTRHKRILFRDLVYTETDPADARFLCISSYATARRLTVCFWTTQCSAT